MTIMSPGAAALGSGTAIVSLRAAAALSPLTTDQPQCEFHTPVYTSAAKDIFSLPLSPEASWAWWVDFG